MNKPKDHLDQDEVQRLLSFVKDHDPVIVGGQSIALYAMMYSQSDEFLQQLGPLTSKDLDFYENDAAAVALADRLVDGRVARPGADTFTPEAAKVTGRLGDKAIKVDFMRSIKGVDAEKVKETAVEIFDPEDPSSSLRLMHPLDCLRSRLANINDLHRTSEQVLVQAQASIRILELFVEGEIEDLEGGRRRVTKLAQELEHVLTDMHYGKPTHLDYSDRLNPANVLHRLKDDPRLDRRWRNRTLAGIIERCERKQEIETARHERFAAK